MCMLVNFKTMYYISFEICENNKISFPVEFYYRRFDMNHEIYCEK